MDPKTVALDFDGVIAYTDLAKTKYAREWLGLDVEESNMKRKYFIELFGERGDFLYSQVTNGIYETEEMLNVPVMPFASQGIKNLQKNGWRCVVATSRSGTISDHSALSWAWKFIVENNITINIEDFYSSQKGSKLDICLKVGARVLVDDDYNKLLPIVEYGFTGFLFTTKPNSNSENEYRPFLAHRIKDWHDLLRRLYSLETGDIK